MIKQTAVVLFIASALPGVHRQTGYSCGCSDKPTENRADAGDPPAPDAEVNTCTVLAPSYPDLGSNTGTAFLIPQDDQDPMGLQFLQIQIPLNQDATPDVLFIELWEDAPPYEPTFATGAVTISGFQADIIQCGACVFIAADVSGPILDFHMASSGTVNVDVVDATPVTGQLMGSISDVKLRKVEIDEDIGQVVTPGGCKTEVAGATFDFVVDLMPAPGLLRPPDARQRIRSLFE